MVEINTINVKSRGDYDYIVSRGFNPLIDLKFKLDIDLRKELIREKFGKFTPAHHNKFYRYCWDMKPHICEETGLLLSYYSASFISHILSKGAHPEMAYDPRNVNILSFQAHMKWENGDRESMKIFADNTKIMSILKDEYKIVRSWIK